MLSLEALLSSAAESCTCLDDWGIDIGKMKGKIAGFNPPPTTEHYEYTGVIVGIMNSYYKACVCSDVLRVAMSITVQSSELYAATATANVSEAVDNITSTLIDMIPSMESVMNAEMFYRFEDITAAYASRSAPEAVTFNLEVVLRGTNESYAPLVKQTLLAATLQEDTNDHRLLFLGPFTVTDTTVKKCTGTPVVAPAGTTRTWSNRLLPPTNATYECPAGQYVTPLGKGVSTCQHGNLTWSTLPTITCVPGCGKEPPSLPLYSERTWDSTTRAIGTNITYTCLDGYRSGDGKDAFSDCTTTGWRNLSKTFFCSELSCDEPISQVPAHAETTFLESKRMAGTEVTYSCISGYRSPHKMDHTIVCKLGNWTLLPEDWKCTNVFAYSLTDSLIGEMDLPDDELTEEERQRKLEMALAPNYFWIVTIPSIIGLIIGMVICLCCTRTDSPLFNICGGHNPDSFGYQEYLKKFGKNG